MALRTFGIRSIVGSFGNLPGIGCASSIEFRSEVEVFDGALLPMVSGSQETNACQQSDALMTKLESKVGGTKVL